MAYLSECGCSLILDGLLLLLTMVVDSGVIAVEATTNGDADAAEVFENM